jgi:hypothetical protein
LKARIPYVIAVVISMVLGYSSRRYADSLPAFIAEHFGDALWASMIYFGFRAIGVNKNLFWAGGISVIFCFGIEFSQLYQVDWMNEIRSTFVGALVLGSGFLTVDLIRYSVGIMIALIVDRYFVQKT